jgi:hypothetical protein
MLHQVRKEAMGAFKSGVVAVAEVRQHVPLHGGRLECVVLNTCSSGFELGLVGEKLYQVGKKGLRGGVKGAWQPWGGERMTTNARIGGGGQDGGEGWIFI